MENSKGRIWIIGNGPSLAWTPLELLKGETTFAMNRIHRIYDKTSWRPSLYWLVDYAVDAGKIWKEMIDVHRKLDIPMWLLDIFRDGYPKGHVSYNDLSEGLGDIPNVTWVSRCKHSWAPPGNPKAERYWHLPEICTSFNHVGGVMQVAVMLGYGPIYLLGCDLGYNDDKSTRHFVPDYNLTDRQDGAFKNANALWAHEVAARSSPVPIFNATLGGELEVHLRVDMLEVLNADKM